MLSGVSYLVSDIWCMLSCVLYLLRGVCCYVSNIWFLVSGVLVTSKIKILTGNRKTKTLRLTEKNTFEIGFGNRMLSEYQKTMKLLYMAIVAKLK